MFQHIFEATPRISKPDTALQIVGRRSKIINFLHHGMMTMGVAAITALAILFIKPELTHQIHAVSPFAKAAQAAVEPIQAVETVTAPLIAEKVSDKGAINKAAVALVIKQVEVNSAPISQQQQSVTTWLSKRYRVAHDATNMLVTSSYVTAKELNLDPLLILSVMAIESGLNPFAESSVGAQGLMQVMSKVHRDKFNKVGGMKAALNPAANIHVGAQILKEYVTRTGSVEGGLKMYVGAALSDNDGGYGGKVLAEYRRLKDVSNGKFVPTITAPAAKIRVIQATEQVEADKEVVTRIEATAETAKDNKSEPEHVTAI